MLKIEKHRDDIPENLPDQGDKAEDNPSDGDNCKESEKKEKHNIQFLMIRQNRYCGAVPSARLLPGRH